jgi:maleate isomerase
MATSFRIGMLTPSSNTVLEPVSTAMLAALPDVTAHFGRFRVTEIALDPGALRQFDMEPMLDAASLLADAKVSAIVWNGTSGSWLGFETDRELCAAIQAHTGVPATSATLALDEIFRRTSIRRYGLVTPYLDAVQDRIVRNFAAEGYECVAEAHEDLRDNFFFATVSAEQLSTMIRRVAAHQPQAICVLCTNLCGAPLVQELEEELGLPIYDSVATAVWSGLRLVGVPHSKVSGWGRLFRDAFD